MKWLFIALALSGNPQAPTMTFSTTVTSDEAECDSALRAAEKAASTMSLDQFGSLTLLCSRMDPVPRVPSLDEMPVPVPDGPKKPVIPKSEAGGRT